MKRAQVLKKLKQQAKRCGLEYSEVELKNHTGIKIGNTKSTLGRHREVSEGTAKAFFDQFANEFGKGWWR